MQTIEITTGRFKGVVAPVITQTQKTVTVRICGTGNMTLPKDSQTGPYFKEHNHENA